MRLSGLELQHATGGHWHGIIPDMIESLKTDTRGFEAGQSFLALRGPNFDGHDFAISIADKALAMVGDAQGVRMWKGLPAAQLEVEDTLIAYGDIAHAWRMQLKDTTIVAISGSYGKTSLRSILECGFSGLGLNVSATSANLNNLIGVPQTLLNIPAGSDIALIECGISEQGEMARLTEIVQPDIAVLTGITHAHSEGLGGFSGVVQEKAALFAHMNDAGWAVLGNGVAELLTNADIQLDCPQLLADGDDAVSWLLDCRLLTMSYGSETTTMELDLPAMHWAENLALASSIILSYLKPLRSITLLEVTRVLSQWQPQAGRMQIIRGRSGCTVLDDSYNANPVSMQAAINTLRALEGRRIAVLGDMAELGDGAESAHAGLDLSGLDEVYLVGPQMKVLARAAGSAIWLATTVEAVSVLNGLQFQSGDTLLIKASRSMGLEAVVKSLCETEEVTHAV